MDVEGRRDKILETLTRRGKVRVGELADTFGISEVTVRSDLAGLEDEGLLRRVHGGAVSTRKAYCNMSLNDRMKTNETEKRRIAKSCASLICNGDTIMMNSGTTTLFAAQELKDLKNLLIVTNSVLIAQEVMNFQGGSAILLGGNMDFKYQYTYGEDTLSQLSRYRADKLILSVDGISSDHGMTTYHHLEADVSRHMIERSDKTIVVADHSKIGREGFVLIDTVQSMDILVTNSGEYNDETERLRKNGIRVDTV